MIFLAVLCRTECTEASFDIESNRLGIGNLGGMFITLVLGSVLALLVHFFEVTEVNALV